MWRRGRGSERVLLAAAFRSLLLLRKQIVRLDGYNNAIRVNLDGDRSCWAAGGNVGARYNAERRRSVASVNSTWHTPSVWTACWVYFAAAKGEGHCRVGQGLTPGSVWRERGFNGAPGVCCSSCLPLRSCRHGSRPPPARSALLPPCHPYCRSHPTPYTHPDPESQCHSGAPSY